MISVVVIVIVAVIVVIVFKGPVEPILNGLYILEQFQCQIKKETIEKGERHEGKEREGGKERKGRNVLVDRRLVDDALADPKAY